MRRQLLGVAALWLAFLPAVVFPQAKKPAAAAPPQSAEEPRDGDDERQRQIAARFLTVLEKNPRRGTALDRVYGYHVEWGTLDALVKG